MNIVHVYRSMGQGGAQKVILQLCNAQRKQGHNVWVISAGGIYEKDLKELGVVHIEIPDIASKQPLDIIKCIKTIRNLCKEIGNGIVHTHHRSAAFDAQIACRGLSEIKLLYTSHNVFAGMRHMLRFALKKTYVVAVGEDVKDNLVNYYGLPEKQVIVIRNSVEKPLIDATAHMFEREEGGFYIGFIGRLAEVKGVDVLIKAVKGLDDSVRIYIIGDGEKAEEYKRLTESLNIKSVHFTGYRKDAMNLIAQFDVIVLPSWQEGFPLTIVESFASGKAVIASNIPGNNELVHDSENGMLFSPGDSDELKRMITELRDNPEKLKALSENARTDYEDNYSFTSFIEKYEVAYKRAGEFV